MAFFRDDYRPSPEIHLGLLVGITVHSSEGQWLPRQCWPFYIRFDVNTINHHIREILADGKLAAAAAI